MIFALVRSLNNFDACLLFYINLSLTNPLISIFCENSTDDLIRLYISGLFGFHIVINDRIFWPLVYLGEFNFSWGNANAFSMPCLRRLYGYFYFLDYFLDVLSVVVFHYYFNNRAHVRAKENRIFCVQVFG